MEARIFLPQRSQRSMEMISPRRHGDTKFYKYFLGDLVSLWLMVFDHGGTDFFTTEITEEHGGDLTTEARRHKVL